MRLIRPLSVSVFCAGFFVAGFMQIPSAHAELQASVQIEQLSPATLGSWTFFSASNSTKSSKDKGVDPKRTAFSIKEFGTVTLAAKLPAGMKSTISIFRNGTLSSSKDTTQVTMNLYPNDTVRFVIKYSYSNVGTFGVTSNPTGAPLTLKGPDGFVAKAKAPYTFTNLPAGKYTIVADAISGCFTSPPYNRNIEQDKRVTIHIDLPCTAKSDADAAVDTSRLSKRAIQEAARLREALRAAKKGS